MTGFSVDHTRLADAGRQVSQYADASAGVAQQVQAAEVPNLAWGLLGVSCGLYEMYVGMLDGLGAHLSDMGTHLDRTGSAMTGTAQAYQQIDERIADTMRELDPGETSA